MGQGSLIAVARAVLRPVIARHPALYLPLRRLRAPGTVLGPDTDLVIEGFPRCANTWTEALIRAAAPGLHLAHHTHAAAHVIAATRAGVPVLVLYRAPEDAVTSLLAMYGPKVSARGAFAAYSAFYHAVLGLDRARYHLASFDQITTAPAQMLTGFAARFDLPLDASRITGPAAHASVLAQMKAREAGNAMGDAAICAPGNAARQSQKTRAAVAQALADPKLHQPRAQAEAVYQRLCAQAGP